MEDIVIVFGAICLLFIWWNLWVSLEIVKYLKKKDQPASLFQKGFFIKGKIFEYVPVYREITRKDTGKTGSLYHLFYISFVGMCLFFLLGIAALLS